MRGGISRLLAGALFSQIRDGTLVVTQDGERHTWGEGPPTAQVTIRSPTA